MLSFQGLKQKLNKRDTHNFMQDIVHLFIRLFKNLKNSTWLRV